MKLDKIKLSPKLLDEATEVMGQLVKLIIELKREREFLLWSLRCI
jgi:hypothetical protein